MNSDDIYKRAKAELEKEQFAHIMGRKQPAKYKPWLKDGASCTCKLDGMPKAYEVVDALRDYSLIRSAEGSYRVAHNNELNKITMPASEKAKGTSASDWFADCFRRNKMSKAELREEIKNDRWWAAISKNDAAGKQNDTLTWDFHNEKDNK